MPTTGLRISLPPYTTDLITGFNPGTSPPPVRIPILSFPVTVLRSRSAVLGDSSGRTHARLSYMESPAHGEQLFQWYASQSPMGECGAAAGSGTIAGAGQ